MKVEMTSNYAERNSFSPQLPKNKKFVGSWTKNSDHDKFPSVKLDLDANALQPAVPLNCSEIHYPNGSTNNEEKYGHDIASMISEWIWTYRNSSKEERGYLIKKGIGFYKSNPAEFFEHCMFDVIETFKSNDVDETLQWDGLKFIYSSIPRHSIDKLSSASSISMRSVNSSLSMPSDDKFVRWARQISLVVAQDDVCMSKIIQFFLQRRAEDSSNAAQQVLRVLCYYQPLLVCSYLTRHGNLLKQTCTEILDATPRFRASFYSYLVYIIDKNPPSKSRSLSQEIFYTQAFVHIVKFLKTYTPVEKKPHKSVIAAAKLMARIFDAADAKIAEKFFSAVKFVEALLVTCRRWCAVCETVRPHFIVVLRALCINQSVLARSVMFNPTTSEKAETNGGVKDDAGYSPRACLLPLLLQMSLSGDAEFFTQLIECIRLALSGDDFKRNDYVFFEPIDPTNADITMVNQLPRLIQNRQMKPEIRIAAARLFSDIIVPESQRVEDFCTSMVRNQDPLSGFLQRTYDQNDPAGVYGTCFAFSKLVAVAHGAAASSSASMPSSPDGTTSRSTTAEPQRAHSEQFESEFRAVYDSEQTVGSGTPATSPEKQQQAQCLLLKMLESLDKTRHPVALFGQLQFLVIFERHYSLQLMPFLRRKRILFALANVITLRGDASVFSRIELVGLEAERAMFSNVNHILALFLLTRCYEQLTTTNNNGTTGSNASLAAYCERFLKCDSTNALLRFYTTTAAVNDEHAEFSERYVHDIFKAAEHFLFMPSNSIYFAPLLASLKEVNERLFAHVEKSKIPALLSSTIITVVNDQKATKADKLRAAKSSFIVDMKAMRKQAESQEKRLLEVEARLAAATTSYNEELSREKVVSKQLESAQRKIVTDREQLERSKSEREAASEADEVSSLNAGELEVQIADMQVKANLCRDQWMPSVVSQTDQARSDLVQLCDANSVDSERKLEHIRLTADCNAAFSQCSVERQKALDEQNKAEGFNRLIELLRTIDQVETRLAAVSRSRDDQRNVLLQKAVRQRQNFEANLVVLARRDEVAKKLQSLLVENNVPLPDLDVSLYSESFSLLSTSFASDSVAAANHNASAIAEYDPGV